MKSLRQFPAALLLTLVMTGAVEAQCDCTEITGGCGASVDLNKEAGTISVSTAAPKCAQVIVDVDNTPYSVLVNGGRAIENVMILHKERAVAVSVRRCNICKDLSPDRVARPDQAGSELPKACRPECPGLLGGQNPVAVCAQVCEMQKADPNWGKLNGK